MPKNMEKKTKAQRRVHHAGRESQILIYLGKQLRFFINESDWKVLPMAAIIAALVAMVIRKRFFINMEGSLIGAFALTCVAIWNGCFNSIQAVCRERPIVKREHRSGMHISAYVLAHMIYQLLLCAAQTGLTMYVLKLLGVPFPAEGFMTRWMIVDIGISMLLISYASDMMSLFLSSISHTTTGAMTIMPFVLIFQLVFSGGIIPLPSWSRSLSNFTISNYGVKAIAAQSGYNERPMVTAWNTLSGMRNREIGGTVTLGQLMDLLNNEKMEQYEDREIIPSFNLAETAVQVVRELNLIDEEKTQEALAEAQADPAMTRAVRLKDLKNLLNSSNYLQSHRDQAFTLKFKVGELFDLFGEENIKAAVQKATAEASYKPEYAQTRENVVKNWVMLGVFIAVFALMSVIVLEMIDKDKR